MFLFSIFRIDSLSITRIASTVLYEVPLFGTINGHAWKSHFELSNNGIDRPGVAMGQ
jgi:hypothetical protein